jgi:hypothetical protein
MELSAEPGHLPGHPSPRQLKPAVVLQLTQRCRSACQHQAFITMAAIGVAEVRPAYELGLGVVDGDQWLSATWAARPTQAS